MATAISGVGTLSSRRVPVKLSRIPRATAHRMTSLDYYAIEELLTDDERAARDRTRRFVQEEAMPEIVPPIVQPNFLRKYGRAWARFDSSHRT